MDDYELLVGLRDHDASRALADRLADRDLYKRAVWAELGDVADDVFDPDEPLFDPDYETVRAFEDDIAADAGVDREHVILDVQGQPSMRESTTGVLVNSEVRRLDEQSTLVRALQMAQREQWRLGVYAPDSLTEPVGRAAERVLGLDMDGALISETTTGEYASLDDYKG